MQLHEKRGVPQLFKPWVARWLTTNKMIPNRRTSCREVQWSTIRFRKRTEKVDAQKRVDKPHMIADALLEKAGEKVLEAKRRLGTVHLDPIIDQIPCGQGDKQFGNVVLVEWGEMPCAGTAEQKISADHEKRGTPVRTRGLISIHRYQVVQE